MSCLCHGHVPYHNAMVCLGDEMRHKQGNLCLHKTGQVHSTKSHAGLPNKVLEFESVKET